MMTEKRIRCRFELMEKHESGKELTADEESELARLQEEWLEYRREIGPMPTGGEWLGRTGLT
jgi:hypothetical protein